VLVQRARDELLAGARLPGDQHRDGGARETADGAEHLLHGRRPPEELGDATGGFPLLARRAARARGAAHERHRLVDVEGLGQVLERPALVGGDRAPQVRVRRHDDDRQRGSRVVDQAQELEPRGTRHADVGDEHVG
jgi:hypothetical protein